jgi:hypothetical protein
MTGAYESHTGSPGGVIEVWLQISSMDLTRFVTGFTSKTKSGQKPQAYRFEDVQTQG